MCEESTATVDQAAPAPHRTLVMRFVETVEWRVVFDAGDARSAARAVESAIAQSGLTWRQGVDPESIRFEVE